MIYGIHSRKGPPHSDVTVFLPHPALISDDTRISDLVAVTHWYTHCTDKIVVDESRGNASAISHHDTLFYRIVK